MTWSVAVESVGGIAEIVLLRSREPSGDVTWTVSSRTLAGTAIDRDKVPVYAPLIPMNPPFLLPLNGHCEIFSAPLETVSIPSFNS